jgi:hypothetical protein
MVIAIFYYSYPIYDKFNKRALDNSIVERENLLYSLDKIIKIEENKNTKTIGKENKKHERTKK